MNKLMGVMELLPQPARKSITFDCGIEFRNWHKLKRARRYLPRDAPVEMLSNRDMKSTWDRPNATPHKCLGYRTSSEAFRDETEIAETVATTLETPPLRLLSGYGFGPLSSLWLALKAKYARNTIPSPINIHSGNFEW